MKNFFAVILLSFAVSTSLHSQYCNTEKLGYFKSDTEEVNDSTCMTFSPCDSASLRDTYLPIDSLKWKTFKIRWNIFTDDNGNGGIDLTEIFKAMHTINKDFAPVKMKFEIYDIDYIANTYYWKGDSSIFSYLHEVSRFNLYPKNIINIHINQSKSGFLGQAILPFPTPADYVPISNNPYISLTQNAFSTIKQYIISHEIGHLFGLYHTFFQGYSFNNGYVECPPFKELPDTSGNSLNGDYTSDFCSDTPPGVEYFSCLTFSNSNVKHSKCNGNPHKDYFFFNYMDYLDSTEVARGCPIIFTPQQMARMHCMVETHRSSWVNNPIIPKVNEQELKQWQFVVYPNPSNSVINIEILNNNTQQATLYNLLGKIMWQNSITQKTSIDVSQYPKGIYLLVVGGISKKVVVQ